MSGLNSILTGLQNPSSPDLVGSFREGQSQGFAGQILSETFGGKLGALGKVDPAKTMALAEGLGIPKNEKERFQAYVGTIQAATALANGPGGAAAAQQLLEEHRLVVLRNPEADTSRLDEQIQFLELEPESGVEGLNVLTNSFIAEGFLADPATVGLTSQEREFASLTKNLSPDDLTSAQRIKLGLDPRAVGSAVQTITGKGTGEEVAVTETLLAGAKEVGKLGAQLKLSPKIKKAVDLAAGIAKETVDANVNNRSNALALRIYEEGINGLSASLQDTAAGPIVGWSPAITANQQIADGSLALMAPILKGIFRASGEGTFTKDDQEILMAMLPDRKDKPASRVAKLKMVDSVVRAKLAPVDTGSEQEQSPIAPDGALTSKSGITFTVKKAP